MGLSLLLPWDRADCYNTKCKTVIKKIKRNLNGRKNRSWFLNKKFLSEQSEETGSNIFSPDLHENYPIIIIKDRRFGTYSSASKWNKIKNPRTKFGMNRGIEHAFIIHEIK